LDSLRHDEWLLRFAYDFLEKEETVTVAPVIGPHSIDLIVFQQGKIRFIEVKGPSGSLTPTEKKLKALIESHPALTYEVLRYENA